MVLLSNHLRRAVRPLAHVFGWASMAQPKGRSQGVENPLGCVEEPPTSKKYAATPPSAGAVGINDLHGVAVGVRGNASAFPIGNDRIWPTRRCDAT